MDFLKKHYEKIILSIVLVGLAVAAAGLPLQVSRVNALLEDTRTDMLRRTKPKPFQPLDDYLRTNRAVVQRLAAGASDIKLAAGHNVFNPVEWKKRPDGSIYKVLSGSELGAGALEITKIDELRLIISFEVPGGDAYRVNFLRESDKNPKPVTRTAKVGVPNDLFTITQAEGSSENPDALLIQLKDGKDQLRVPKQGGYNEVIGYAADLRYVPGKQVFQRRRKGDSLKIEDETYKIVAIDRNEVVLSAESTHKRTFLRFNATAQVK